MRFKIIYNLLILAFVRPTESRHVKNEIFRQNHLY